MAKRRTGMIELSGLEDNPEYLGGFRIALQDIHILARGVVGRPFEIPSVEKRAFTIGEFLSFCSSRGIASRNLLNS